MKKTFDDIIEDIVDGAIDVSDVVIGLLGLLLIACFHCRYYLLITVLFILLFKGIA